MRTGNQGMTPLWVLAAVLLLISGAAHATNGMYLVGYGAETVGRGGANLAISDRSLALNFNPAGISQLQGNHFTINLSLLAPDLAYGNGLNTTLDGEDELFPLPAFAYVRGGKETPWTWGLGFVAQGGMGATFTGTNTFFGTRDSTYSEVRFATLSPTVSYSISETMSVGATVNLGWADASFDFFPETSFLNPVAPEQSFFGISMEQAGGMQSSVRLGWLWQAHPAFAVGLMAQSETESDFEGGDTLVNFEGHPGLGQRVAYDTRMDGFTFAAQAGLGIAARPARKWVIAADIKRYFWDDAIDTITVTAEEPGTPGAPPTIVMPFVFNWEDQWIYALGADYRATDLLTLRAGLNYGENPVPGDTLTPLFPATTERHVSVGASWLRSNKLFELAVERAFNKDQVNNNPDPMVNPFGPGSAVSHNQWTLSFGVSWALDRGGQTTTVAARSAAAEGRATP